MLTVVICLILSKQGKDYALVLVICVCCMVAAVAIDYLQDIIYFIERLQSVGNLNTELIEILIKAVGIGLLSEITSLICTDSGNSALGKSLQILSTAVILWLCLPLFSELLDVVEGVLGAA